MGSDRSKLLNLKDYVQRRRNRKVSCKESTDTIRVD